jgi:DNA polymerase-3 subunit gamma/tau
MSYTVLARKWRPRRFEELVGQEHVVQALVNSLSAERVHHAYLFSGTRGVGKTTVARILAKALNCDEGIVAEPCGKCATCLSIDDGRFVDLLEVDAARFKVYLIDEVHMLSKHSFNALLKTLEEPPPHVKFLLATTDPQRLPVTVLSRCLQFNLKKLTHRQIDAQLMKICEAEGLDAEPAGLSEVARAADGSMRDGLSLLDQAIAFSGGAVTKQAIDTMLGTIDRDHVCRILAGLSAADGSALMSAVAELDEFAPDYGVVLDELMGELQRIAVIQLVGFDENQATHQALKDLASEISEEDVQLYYQIALQSRRDIGASRNARSAFEMALLRMLAFRPGAGEGRRSDSSSEKKTLESTTSITPKREKTSAEKAPPRSTRADTIISVQPILGDWESLLKNANVHGAARQLAENCTIKDQTGSRVALVLAEKSAHLNTDHVKKQLETAIERHLGQRLTLDIVAGSPPIATPAQLREAGESQRMRKAREAIEQDPNVKAVQAAFDAVVEPDSVQPVEK